MDIGGVGVLIRNWIPGDPPRPAPAVLTTEEVAAMLGNAKPESRRAQWEVFTLRHRGILRGIRIGRHQRYRLKDVLEVLRIAHAYGLPVPPTKADFALEMREKARAEGKTRPKRQTWEPAPRIHQRPEPHDLDEDDIDDDDDDDFDLEDFDDDETLDTEDCL